MGPDQREAIQMLIDLLDRNIPALDGVTLLAVGAHLGLVNVRMALPALRSDIRENRLGMALRAGNTLVHAAQRILGGVVIKFRNGADRLPTA